MKTTIFNSIIELITTFDTEQKCIDFLEKQRWNGKVVSPYDSNSKVYKCSNNLYKCKNTRRLFNVRTNTLFEGSNISLRTWFLAIYLIASHKKGISSCQLAKDLHVTQKQVGSFYREYVNVSTLKTKQFCQMKLKLTRFIWVESVPNPKDNPEVKVEVRNTRLLYWVWLKEEVN